MDRRSAVFLGLAATLAACAKAPAIPLGTDGKPLPQVYPITTDMAPEISFRVLDGLNAVRSAKGVSAVVFNAELNAACATHSRDMAVQNRPWHFGSDGSSPLVRVQRVGYGGKLLGELISETFETELQTLAEWMARQDTRDTLMDPRAGEIGFAWFQESNGKIWWTMLVGQAAGTFATPSPLLSQ